MEQDKGSEIPKPTEIERLPEALGFVETPELSQLRNEVVRAMTADDEKQTELLARYELLGHAVVDRYSDRESYAKAQIGLIIQIGLIRRAGGTDYHKDLEDASDYAWNARLDLAALLDETTEDK